MNPSTVLIESRADRELTDIIDEAVLMYENGQPIAEVAKWMNDHDVPLRLVQRVLLQRKYRALTWKFTIGG